MELQWVRKINGLVGRHIAFDMFMDFIARFGHLAFVLYGLWLWFGDGDEGKKERRAAALLSLAGVLLCSVISFGIGRCWERPRPFTRDGKIWNFTGHKPNGSFPSNHTMNSAVISMVLIGMKMPFRFCMAAMAALLAFSRVFAGIHYPSDLLGGAGIAFLVYKGVLSRAISMKAAMAGAGAAALAAPAFRKARRAYRFIRRGYGD